MSFFANFLKAKGNDAIDSLTKAVVKLDPESASLADLATMEQDLDRAGKLVISLRADLAREQADLDKINAQYSQLMSASEVIKGKIAAPATDDVKRTSLQKSLSELIGRLESVVPNLDTESKAVADTQALLSDAEQAYQEKATGLTQAKSQLEQAKHDMQHAVIQEERAEARADRAAEVAGLRKAHAQGLQTALTAMRDTASDARDRAAVSDMKADALRHSTASANDPNIVEAMQEAGTAAPAKSLEDRLAALKR